MEKYAKSLGISKKNHKFRILVLTSKTSDSRKWSRFLYTLIVSLYKTHTVIHNLDFAEIHIDGQSKIKFICSSKFKRMHAHDRESYDILELKDILNYESKSKSKTKTGEKERSQAKKTK